MPTDRERFLLGSILPDAIEPGNRDRSHFKVRTDTQIWFDFEAFRAQFSAEILRDDLYLGYYMHLVEDAFYRAFIYTDRFVMPRTREEVQLLHGDYHILNAYIVRKYRIRNVLKPDYDLEKESVSRIAPFRVREFLQETAEDFTERTEGSTVFLTESMLDEFLETYLPMAEKELEAMRRGEAFLKAADFAWPAKR